MAFELRLLVLFKFLLFLIVTFTQKETAEESLRKLLLPSLVTSALTPPASEKTKGFRPPA